VPKDHPSTPAVVISEAALADAKRKADRARIAQTIPAQTRSAPFASPAPLSSPAAALLDDTQTRPRRRSTWPVVLGACVAIAAGVALVVLPSGSGEKPSSPSAGPPQAVAASTAPVEPAPASAPSAAPAEVAEVPAPAPSVREPMAQAEPPTVAVKRRPVKKPFTAPAAAPRKSSSRSPSAGEPTSTVAPRPAKGVIVRETPF
jgi:hypothetical protein